MAVNEPVITSYTYQSDGTGQIGFTGGAWDATIGDPIGDPWEFSGSGIQTWRAGTTPYDALTDPAFTTCVVCGAQDEDIFILCSLCRESVVEARKGLIRNMILDIESTTTERATMSHHCGYTKSGSLEHAVGFFGGKEYAPRAACGVRIFKTKRRIFDGDKPVGVCCQRCVGSERV